MSGSRPTTPIRLDGQGKDHLRSIVRSRSEPHGMVERGGIVLACGEGESHVSIGSRLGISKMTVGKWRRRYLEQGIEGLREKERPGGPRTHDDERVAEVGNTALHSKPPQGTYWSVRTMGEHRGISKSMVHWWFKMFGVRLHRQRHFKIANDPFFVEKVHDIVGLYMSSPDHVVALCVDEKTQIQILERTQPLLPLGVDYVKCVTHDYISHGMTTLFAVLNVATIKVLRECKERHRHQEFLAFLKHIEANVTDFLDIHLIVDN